MNFIIEISQMMPKDSNANYNNTVCLYKQLVEAVDISAISALVNKTRVEYLLQKAPKSEKEPEK